MYCIQYVFTVQQCVLSQGAECVQYDYYWFWSPIPHTDSRSRYTTYSIQYTKERDIQSWAHASTVATIRHCFMANRLSPVALPLNAYLYSMFSPRTEHVSYFSLSQNTRSFITLSHCRLSYCYRIVSSPALCICIVSGAVSVIWSLQNWTALLFYSPLYLYYNSCRYIG